MRIGLIIAAAGAVAALSSCSTVSHTAYTATPETMILNMTVADLDVKPEKVTATTSWSWNPFKTNKSRKQTAEYEALKASGGDLLIEPVYEFVDGGWFRGGSVTVTGYPANYVNFRPLTQAEADVIATLRGDKVAVATPYMKTTAPSLMDKLKKKTSNINLKGNAELKDSYNRFSIGYKSAYFSPSSSSRSEDLKNIEVTGSGITLQYLHGFGVSRNLPLYIETGLNLDIFDVSEDMVEGERINQNTYASLAIPVNIAYNWGISKRLSIQPYTGFNFKFNLTDNALAAYNYEYETRDFNRFQMGWNIGLGVSFSKLYVGINYDIDFMPIEKYSDRYGDGDVCIDTSSFSVKLGLNF